MAVQLQFQYISSSPLAPEEFCHKKLSQFLPAAPSESKLSILPHYDKYANSPLTIVGWYNDNYTYLNLDRRFQVWKANLSRWLPLCFSGPKGIGSKDDFVYWPARHFGPEEGLKSAAGALSETQSVQLPIAIWSLETLRNWPDQFPLNLSIL